MPLYSVELDPGSGLFSLRVPGWLGTGELILEEGGSGVKGEVDEFGAVAGFSMIVFPFSS